MFIYIEHVKHKNIKNTPHLFLFIFLCMEKKNYCDISLFVKLRKNLTREVLCFLYLFLCRLGKTIKVSYFRKLPKNSLNQFSYKEINIIILNVSL